jgi:hypothetical protein
MYRCVGDVDHAKIVISCTYAIVIQADFPQRLFRCLDLVVAGYVCGTIYH